MEGGASLKLTRSSFEQSEIERCGLGGGFIPVAEDGNGNFQVLLGESVSCRTGRVPVSPFEGSRKEGESLSDASIREFCEETMCLLHSHDETKRIVDEVLDTHRVEDRERAAAGALPLAACGPVPRSDAPHTIFELRMQIEQIDRLQQDMQLSFPEFLRGVGEVGEICSDEDGTQILTEFALRAPTVAGRTCTGGIRRTGVECQRRLLALENLRERLGSAIDNCSTPCVRE